MLGRLSERLGTQFSASSVFSEPVERDSVTIVPVASVRFRYIELKDGRSR